MLKTILKHIVVCVLPIIGTVQAQNNCDDLLRKAKDAHSKGHYADAFAKYRAVKLCNPALSSEMEKQIDKLFVEVDAQRVRAEQAEKKATEEKNAATTARQKAEVAEIAANDAKEKTERILESLYFFDDKFGVAVRNQKYGFIDRDGNIIISCKYLNAGNFNANGYARVEIREGEFRMLDTTGREYIYALSLNKLTPQTELLDLSEIPLKDFDLPEPILQANNLKVLILEQCNLKTLPASLARLTNLEVLILDRNSFKDLPEFIFQFTNLRQLSLVNCEFKTLPPTIGGLSKLEHLNLTYNPIRQLPETINNLKNLQTLDCFGCDLQTLPNNFLEQATNLKKLNLAINKLINIPADFLATFTNLQSLDFQGNQLTTTPYFPYLPHLQTVIFTDNPFTEFTIDLNLVPNLVELELGDCNQLSKLQINNSNNLKSLSLSFSKLTELPDGVKKLAHLQSLDLRGSNITKLPDSTNFAKSLRVLDLDDTENLTTLSGIQNFSNLRSLSICGSPQAVKNLSNALNNLKRLEYLYLKDNDLTNLDINFSQLNNLKELIISENFLSNIPPSIQYLTHLEKLEANFNKFTSFPNTKLPQLKELELSSCQLHTFDIDAANFPMLKELTLNDNKLQSLPNLPTELTYLNISTNPLAQLPQNFEQLTQLKNIMMFETQINSLPENLGLLQALEKLDISDSPYLSVLPKSFGKLNALRELNILNTPNLFKNGFPLELTQLSALTSLDLSDCNISAIPNEISHLTKLEYLSLDGSPSLFKNGFPLELTQLSALASLSLSDCNIPAIPNEISHLTKLGYLFLDGSPSLAPKAKAIKKLLPKTCNLSID